MLFFVLNLLMFELVSLVADNHNALAVASIWAPVVAVSSMPSSTSACVCGYIVCLCLFVTLWCVFVFLYI